MPNDKPKRGPGRPPRAMPPRIDASPERIARVALNTNPPKRWKYLETYGKPG